MTSLIRSCIYFSLQNSVIGAAVSCMRPWPWPWHHIDLEWVAGERLGWCAVWTKIWIRLMIGRSEGFDLSSSKRYLHQPPAANPSSCRYPSEASDTAQLSQLRLKQFYAKYLRRLHLRRCVRVTFCPSANESGGKIQRSRTPVQCLRISYHALPNLLQTLLRD